MAYNKSTPIKAGVCDLRVCGKGRIWTSQGVDVTDVHKKLGTDKKIIKQYGTPEMLQHYIEKQDAA